MLGESGLGKSTLIQSLFGSDITSGTISKTNYISTLSQASQVLYPLGLDQYSPDIKWDVCSLSVSLCLFLSLLSDHPSSRIDTTTVEIEPFVDKGIKLKLTVVDTPGFGDNVDNTDW